MSIVSRLSSVVLPIFGLCAAAPESRSALNETPPPGRRPVPPRDVLGPDKARRAARRERARHRKPRVARGAHLAQLGPYGHKDRRPDPTGERAARRKARCTDCWSSGQRQALVAFSGARGPLQVNFTCGCVRS